MLRSCLASCVLLCACGEQRLRPQPLPELVVATASRDLPRIEAASLWLVPGESFVWDVHWKGLTIARAEMFVAEAEVRSRVATGALASSFARLRHDLSTLIDRSSTRPRGGEEILVEDDDTSRADVVAGKVGHTFHTALGMLRAWARADARPGYLQVLHLGELYRLDVDAPLVEDLRGTRTYKIVGRIRGKASPIHLAIWLGADDARAPLRIEIAQDGSKLTAELVHE